MAHDRPPAGPAAGAPSSPAGLPGWRTVEIRPPDARAETWNVLRVALLIAAAVWIYLAGGVAPVAAPWAGGDGSISGRRWAGQTGVPGGVSAGAGAQDGGRDLMPWQRSFRTLGAADQRLFRELQEGLLEAENARSATGAWPAPAALAARGVPPFADLPAPRQRIYRWELRREGLAVNYLGAPAGAVPDSAAAGAPAFLLLVQEPDPRAPADPALPAAGAAGPGGAAAAGDEFHHRLMDGTVLHVSTWMLPAAGAWPAGGARPDPPAVPPLPRSGGAITNPSAAGWLQLVTGAAAP
jgi:hypothetical protein